MTSPCIDPRSAKISNNSRPAPPIIRTRTQTIRSLRTIHRMAPRGRSPYPTGTAYIFLCLHSLKQQDRRVKMDLYAVLQVTLATVVCFGVGWLWFSPLLFGPTWWKYQFPGRTFGDCENSSKFPLSMAAFALVIQNCVLTFTINTLLASLKPTVMQDFPPLGFPILCATVVATASACVSLPHYLFANQPLPLFMINSAYDTAVYFTSIMVIYMLA